MASPLGTSSTEGSPSQQRPSTTKLPASAQTWQTLGSLMPRFVANKPANSTKLFAGGGKISDAPGNLYTPFPTTCRHRRYFIDRHTILSQWQGLKDLKSIDYQQLSQLVDVEESRNIALKFKGKEAAAVINAIDRVSSTKYTNPTTVPYTHHRSSFLISRRLNNMKARRKPSCTPSRF